MIWDTSIWRLGCSNHSKIRSAQKCYPCLRYVVSPMSPGRTEAEVARPGRLELPTLCLEDKSRSAISLLFLGSAYSLHDDFVCCSGAIGPRFWGEPLRWHNFLGHSFRFRKSVLASPSRKKRIGRRTAL